MAHDLFGERFYSYRQPAWHNLGKVMTTEMNATAAFNEVGAYDVQLEEMFLADGTKVDNRAVVRSATADDPVKRIFGTVGPEYTLVDPLEFCGVWDRAVRRNVETLGALQNGAMLFITTKLPTFDIRGDEVENYLLAYSPMSGMEAINVRVSPVRVVCRNTLEAAKSVSTETYRIVHDSKARERLAAWLDGIADRAEAKAETMKIAFDAMAGVALKSEQVTTVLEGVYPDPKPPREDAPELVMAQRMQYFDDNRKAAERAREIVMDIFEGKGLGMDIPAANRTAWGLYNAIIEKEDYAGRTERRLLSRSEDVLFGTRRQVKEKAYVEVMAQVTK